MSKLDEELEMNWADQGQASEMTSKPLSSELFDVAIEAHAYKLMRKHGVTLEHLVAEIDDVRTDHMSEYKVAGNTYLQQSDTDELVFDSEWLAVTVVSEATLHRAYVSHQGELISSLRFHFLCNDGDLLMARLIAGEGGKLILMIDEEALPSDGEQN